MCPLLARSDGKWATLIFSDDITFKKLSLSLSLVKWFNCSPFGGLHRKSAVSNSSLSYSLPPLFSQTWCSLFLHPSISFSFLLWASYTWQGHPLLLLSLPRTSPNHFSLIIHRWYQHHNSSPSFFLTHHPDTLLHLFQPAGRHLSSHSSFMSTLSTCTTWISLIHTHILCCLN